MTKYTLVSWAPIHIVMAPSAPQLLNQPAKTNASLETEAKHLPGEIPPDVKYESDRPSEKDCWDCFRTNLWPSSSTHKKILFGTLPELARKVQLQKRKKIIAEGTAIVGGLGLAFVAISIGTSSKDRNGLDIAAAIGVGATSIATFAFAVYAWLGIETEEYSDLVEELRKAHQNQNQHPNFKSDILANFAARTNWRQKLYDGVDMYRGNPTAILQAWPERDLESGTENTSAGAPDNRVSVPSLSQETVADVIAFCDLPKKGSPLKKFLKIYGKKKGHEDLEKCIEACFPKELRKYAEQLIRRALEANGFQKLEKDLLEYVELGRDRDGRLSGDAAI